MTGEPAAPAPATGPGWRKRHPVLARTLLYAVLLALGGGLAVAFLGRRETDRRDREAYLVARVDMAGLVYLQDMTGAEVLKVVRELEREPDLPALARQRLGRLEALAEARGRRREAAEAAFARAEALPAPAREKAALLVEWADVRSEAGDAEGALRLLDRPEVPTDGALAILAALSRSFAESRRGKAAEGQAALERTLEALPRPLPPGQDHVGSRTWTAAEAALFATEALTRGERAADPAPWRRMRALAPSDFGVQRAAAAALDGVRLPDEALDAWRAAHAASPAEAEHAAKGDAVLGGLEERRRKDALKSGRPSGR